MNKRMYLNAIRTIALKYSSDSKLDSLVYHSRVIANSYSLDIRMVLARLCCAINHINNRRIK